MINLPILRSIVFVSGSNCSHQSTKNLLKSWTIKPNRIGGRYYSKENKDETNEGKLTCVDPKGFLAKEFPDCFTSDGKFAPSLGYVDIVNQGLDRMKDLGLERDINAYKELLKVFPEGKFHKKSRFDIGMFHAPQQMSAIRLIYQMRTNLIRPDKEMEYLVIKAFGKDSDVWLRITRSNYWTMKGRNINPNPLPEILPEKPHELAKVAVARMVDDPEASIVVTRTNSIPEAIDKTWVVFCQSQIQRSIIERLEENRVLFVEDHGHTYVDRNSLSYFTLKVYDTETEAEERKRVVEKNHNYNRLKMNFYGKPIREKLKEAEEKYHVGDGYILAVGMTGTSSPDSISSMLKLLQRRNPRLEKLNIIFKLSE